MIVKLLLFCFCWSNIASAMNSLSLHTIEKSSDFAILQAKTLDHPLFQESLSVLDYYSLLKFGDSHAIQVLAEDLARKLKKELPSEDFKQVAITTAGYRVAQGGAFYLAESVAKLLGSEFIHLNRRSTPEVSYSSQGSLAARRQLVKGQFEFSKLLKQKSVVFLDDAIVSGTHAEEIKSILPIGTSYKAACILRVLITDLSQENKINEGFVLRDTQTLLVVLNNTKSWTLRGIKTVLALPAKEFRAVVAGLKVNILQSLVELAQAEGFQSTPTFSFNWQFANMKLRLGGVKTKTIAK